MSHINVNLTQCPTWCRHNSNPTLDHFINCPGKPVLIHCPIPRTLTVTVRLGKCQCTSQWAARGSDGQPRHTDSCHARPVNVSCSISVKTWEESEVKDWYPDAFGREPTQAELDTLGAACRDRWALVKALVTGKPHPGAMELVGRWHILDLFKRRDAVFAAIADMARAEEACLKAEGRISLRIVEGTLFWPDGERRPSQRALERYVEHLIEQVMAIS